MGLTVAEILTQYGLIGVEALRDDVSRVSATNKTQDSIRFEVSSQDNVHRLVFFARKYFSALETGRGPRKSSEDSGFKDEMYEYMQARGIGQDLPEKKRKALAKFLVLKINLEGDKTFKKGGRVVYSPTLQRIIFELTKALKEDRVKYYKLQITTLLKA